jgi:hypothetical protein
VSLQPCARPRGLVGFVVVLLALPIGACGGDDTVGGAADAGGHDGSPAGGEGDAISLGDASPDDDGGPVADAGPGGDGGSCRQADIESNGTSALARPLASTTDCDKNGNTIKGTADGAGDVDFFKFHGNDNFNCIVNPQATIAVAGFRLCLFADCDGSGGSVSCKSGTATTDGALSGCCVDSPTTQEIGVNCSGFFDDSSTVYIRVQEKTAAVCRNYTVTYHY